MQVVYGFSVVSLKDKGQAKQRSLQISVYNPELVCEEINNLLISSQPTQDCIPRSADRVVWLSLSFRETTENSMTTCITYINLRKGM